MTINQSINQPIDESKNILYRSDCKDTIDHLIKNKIQVDLIYLDPPFNSSRIYNLIFKSHGVTAQQKAFHDMWSLTSQNQQLLFDFEKIIERARDISDIVKDFLKAWVAPLKAGKRQDQKMLIYLLYMTQRLILMKRVLKETGSIYFHCDPTASHYIKIIMDGIFGRENFRNEIIWHYDGPQRPSKKNFGTKHDTILRYSKTKDYFTNEDGIKVWQKVSDNDLSKYKKDQFGNRYYDLPKGDYTEKSIKSLSKQGRIRITSKGNERVVYFLKKDKKGDFFRQKQLHDTWSDIHSLGHIGGKESLGYPTQKPVALLDRIIKASCPEDGIVFDPFCGCGTTIASAINENRGWIGCDISSLAIQVIKERIQNINLKTNQQSILDNVKYSLIEGSPETRQEYERLNPYEKQDWLINQTGGFTNQRKSGDEGIDGEMTIHLGFDKKGKDIWGKMIFSVKTGKQKNLAMIRELIGTMTTKKGTMGGLILDTDPTEKMEELARKQKQLKYQYSKDLPPQYFDHVQILTADEVIDKKRFHTPPTLAKIKLYRDEQQTGLF